MRWALIWLIIASACVSCRTTKKTITDVVEENHIEYKTDIQKIDSLNAELNQFSWTGISFNQSTTAHIRVYDTSKDADSTGQYPLLAEIDIEQNQESEIETKDSVSASIVEVEKERDDVSIVEDSKLDYHSEVEKEREQIKLSWATILFTLIIFVFAVFSNARNR